MFSVVGEQLMASGKALSAISGLLKTDRQLPGVEGDRIPDVARVVGRMSIMACPAGAPLHRLVDMDEMQVLIPVSKGGQFRCPFVVGQGFFMAHETEFVVFLVIAGIKNRWEVFAQDPEIVGAMGVVAPRAILLFYRAVKFGIGIQQGLHVCHALRTGHILLVMAAHAEVRRLHGQLFDVIGHMGVMAGKAFLFRHEPLVLHGCRVDIRLLFLVAGKAEIL